MDQHARQAHWENVYRTKAENEVSWFQESPAISLSLIGATGVSSNAAIIDVGGGSSRLAGELVASGFTQIAVLDLSEAALMAAKARLGSRALRVEWIVADITTWEPTRQFDVWHDRAAFHFLTDPIDRTAYVKTVAKAVRSGGHVIIGTFAPDGPEKCSGLPVMRHDAKSISDVLGQSFRFVERQRHDHQTAWGSIQHFQFTRFQRIA